MVEGFTSFARRERTAPAMSYPSTIATTRQSKRGRCRPGGGVPLQDDADESGAGPALGPCGTCTPVADGSLEGVASWGRLQVSTTAAFPATFGPRLCHQLPDAHRQRPVAAFHNGVGPRRSAPCGAHVGRRRRRRWRRGWRGRTFTDMVLGSVTSRMTAAAPPWCGIESLLPCAVQT